MKAADIVKGSKVSRFVRFREGNFVYETDNGFQFAIPLSEIVEDKAMLQAEERTITLMRWIRKFCEDCGSPI